MRTDGTKKKKKHAEKRPPTTFYIYTRGRDRYFTSLPPEHKPLSTILHRGVPVWYNRVYCDNDTLEKIVYVTGVHEQLRYPSKRPNGLYVWTFPFEYKNSKFSYFFNFQSVRYAHRVKVSKENSRRTRLARHYASVFHTVSPCRTITDCKRCRRLFHSPLWRAYKPLINRQCVTAIQRTIYTSRIGFCGFFLISIFFLPSFIEF